MAKMTIQCIKGDITKITDVQAIVNAANTSLLGATRLLPYLFLSTL